MKIGQELFLSLKRADGISCRWVLLEVSRIQVPILSHDILKKETLIDDMIAKVCLVSEKFLLKVRF